MQEVKISLCTVSMNRLAHIMATLPANIAANKDYNNLEFVLLDYHSSDGLEEWVKANLADHISSGRLKFFRTTEPLAFNRSHSSNMVFKLASGDIICRIDADNYTGEGFARYVQQQFSKESNIYLSTSMKVPHTAKDVMGRICLWKKDFEKVGGYDENMDGYGFEDLDISNRLKLTGLIKESIYPRKFLHAIQHEDTLRISDEYIMKKMHQLLVHHISPAHSRVLILLNDATCILANITDSMAINAHRPEVFKEVRHSHIITHYQEWEYGYWAYNDHKNIHLHLGDKKDVMEIKQASSADNGPIYMPLVDPAVTEYLVMMLSQSKSRHYMANNKNRAVIIPNNKEIGRGNVYKNFNYEETVSV
jgi:glycosyltransferase involved in cell wall biosynthesis